MKNKLRQIISTLITEELNEMARIATTLAIGDAVKLAKAKSLFDNDSWIGKMITAVEAAGEVGITRDALIDATNKNQLALNPKIKDFLEIGLFIEVGLETPKKEKTVGADGGLRGRKASNKTLVAKDVNSKLEADNEYQANEAELETLGVEFIEKLRIRVKDALRRGRPADPTKVKDGMKKTLKGIMSLDTDEDGIIDDFEDEDVVDESFIRMQKLAGLNENSFNHITSHVEKIKEKIKQEYPNIINDGEIEKGTEEWLFLLQLSLKTFGINVEDAYDILKVDLDKMDNGELDWLAQEMDDNGNSYVNDLEKALEELGVEVS